TARPRSPACCSAPRLTPAAAKTRSRDTSAGKAGGPSTPASRTSTGTPAAVRRSRTKATSFPLVSRVPISRTAMCLSQEKQRGQARSPHAERGSHEFRSLHSPSVWSLLRCCREGKRKDERKRGNRGRRTGGTGGGGGARATRLQRFDLRVA